jgi:hypothetical protein
MHRTEPLSLISNTSWVNLMRSINLYPSIQLCNQALTSPPTIPPITSPPITTAPFVRSYIKSGHTETAWLAPATAQRESVVEQLDKTFIDGCGLLIVSLKDECAL